MRLQLSVSDSLAARLQDRATTSGASVSALVAVLLDQALTSYGNGERGDESNGDEVAQREELLPVRGTVSAGAPRRTTIARSAETPSPGEARPMGTENPSPSEARHRTASTALHVHPSAEAEQLSRDLLDDLIAVGISAGGPPLPTRENGGGRVLVYATRRALEQAARLLPGRIIEVEVRRAIARGDVDASQKGGFVFLDEHGVVARCVREPGRLRPRPRSWTVVDVVPRRPR